MSELDPTDDTAPAGPQDTQSSDQSKSKLRQAWDAWTARPENNAALLQFGIAMLQPRAPGQSALGAAANAVGSGAEAADRNVSAQRAEADSAAKREVEARTAGSRETTANAYAQAVKDQAAGRGKGSSLTTTMRQQVEFNKWVRAPADPLAADPVVEAVKKIYPDVKSKADLLVPGPARTAAFKIFAQAGGGDSGEDGDVTNPDTSTGPGTATPAPQQVPVTTIPPPRMYQGRQIHVDPKQRVWVFDDGTPVQ